MSNIYQDRKFQYIFTRMVVNLTYARFSVFYVKIAGRLEVSYFMVVPFLSRKKFIFIDSWMVV